MALFPDGTSSPNHFRTMKWVGLVIGCMAKFVTGSLFVFNVYEDAIRYTFNYTETEVQVQSSLLNIGLGCGVIPGKIYDNFGPQWASLGGIVVSVLAYTLLWSTTKSVSFYGRNSWLMAIYFFLTGLGSVFTYMVALNTNVINFDEKHRGKIVGLLNAFFAGSPSVFSAIYYHVIGNPTSANSFETFMLIFAIGFGITDVACLLFLRVYKTTDSLKENAVSINSSTPDTELTHKGSIEDTDSKSNCCEISKEGDKGPSFIELLRNVDFYLLALMVTCSSVVGLVYIVALTQTTGAMGFKSHDPEVVLIVPITNAVLSAFVGFFSDRYKEKFPRLFVLILGYVAFVISETLIIALADRYVWIVIASIFNGVGVSFLWSLSPTIMSEYFGVANLGRNWGFVLFVGSLIGLGGQAGFGAFYDAAKTNPSDLDCYGFRCIRSGHAVVLACGIVSVALGLVLFFKRKRLRQEGFQRF